MAAEEEPYPGLAQAREAFAGEELRVALVISGAVSLGSYEAGALSAMLSMLARSGGRIVVDTIVGASAGSITGLLLAHTLLAASGGADEEDLWVKQTSLQTLLRGKSESGRPRGPLSTSLLEEWAEKELQVGGSPMQQEHIYLVLSVANLQGLTYRMAMHGRDEIVRADTYRDAVAFDLTTETPQQTWTAAMEAAVASSAHAFAFSGKWLSRRKDEYPPEIDWQDGTTGFWYTDGGTVYNEPFGLALDAVFSPLDVRLKGRNLGARDRLFLLIHPHPDDPLSPWPHGGGEPVFGQSSLRAFNMQRAQSLYEDLLRLEKYNGRLEWRRRVEDAMRREGLEEAEWVKALAAEASAERARRRARTKRVVERAAEAPPAEPSAEAPTSLQIILDAATGTAGKEFAWVEVVSPDLDPRILGSGGKTHVRDLLAGERLGHFLGFADERARRSDFRLGYENFRQWWEGTAWRPGFRIASNMVDLGVPLRDWRGWEEFGQFSLADIPWYRRFVWSIRLMWRYGREVRALMKGSRKRGPVPPSTG